MMSIQKATLILILFCSNFYIASCDDAPLFSEIQPVERQKFLGLMQELGKSKKSDKEIAQDVKIMSRINTLLHDYAQIFSCLYESFLEQGQEFDLQVFCTRVQQDPNLTNLVKNIVLVLCQESEFVKTFFETYLGVQKGIYTNEQYLISLRSYLPKNIDVVQFFLEDFVWSFRYLYRTFELKRVITIDDICNVVGRTAFYFDYLCGLNFDNQHPYLVYKHEDTLHPHIHIVTSKILSSGKSINDSNLKYKSQKLTRELEIKYSLTQVSSQKTTISKDFNTELTEGSGLKEKLDFHLNFAIKVLKVQSMRQLQVYLNENNLDYTYVARINEIEGKPHFFDGKLYLRLPNLNGDLFPICIQDAIRK